MPEIRYIKLGENGCYEESCILGDRASPDGDCIRLGYETPGNLEIHDLCLQGHAKDSDVVRNHWREFRLAKGAKPKTVGKIVSNDIRQISDFYSLPPETIWFTFFRGRLWWCQAEDRVVRLDDHTRIRKTLEGWKDVGRDGKKLLIESLDGRLTQTASYRGTICGVGKQHEYLLRKIQGKEVQEVMEARNALAVLHDRVINLIKGLWWHDFEILVDLIFSRAGWQRISILGKTEKGYDMILVSPVNDRRAFVQVKSRATQGALDHSIKFFGGATNNGGGNYDEMYFVVHTPQGRILSNAHDGNVHIMGPDQIAKLCVNSGLVQWLIDKRS